MAEPFKSKYKASDVEAMLDMMKEADVTGILKHYEEWFAQNSQDFMDVMTAWKGSQEKDFGTWLETVDGEWNKFLQELEAMKADYRDEYHYFVENMNALVRSKEYDFDAFMKRLQEEWEPSIDPETDHWMIGERDTGISAKGAAATISVGTVTTGAQGSAAQVTNSGDQHDAILNFTLPRGEKGDRGEPGLPGSSGEVGGATEVYEETSTSSIKRAVEIPWVETYDDLKNKVVAIRSRAIGTSASESTLNVNGLGDVAVYYIINGAPRQTYSPTHYLIGIETIYTVVYNGTYFLIQTDNKWRATTSGFGLALLNDTITSRAADEAATANAVRQAAELAETAQATADKALASSTEGNKSTTYVIGHVNSGHTEKEVDYLCTGVNDHTVINNAISALPVGGGKIVLREGTYNLSVRIYIDKGNVTIEGMGDATIINKTHNGYAFVVEGQNCTISNLYIEGNKTEESPVGNNTGLYLSSLSTGFILYRVSANNHGGGGILVGSGDISIIECKFCNNGNNTDTGNGITFNATSDAIRSRILIYKCECTDNTLYGIRMNNYAEYCKVEGCTISGHTYGVFITATGHDNTITRNVLTNNEYGVYCAGPNNVFVGNACDGNNNGVYITSDNNNVRNNTHINGKSNTERQVSIRGDNNVVSDNIYQYNINVIDIYGKYNVISNNVLSDNAGFAIYSYGGCYNTITNNVADDYLFGVYLYDKSAGNVISGNYFGTTKRPAHFYTIAAGAGAKDNLITGNILLDKGVVDQGTGNTITNNKVIE